jgi:hypothetical protein
MEGRFVAITASQLLSKVGRASGWRVSEKPCSTF